jgi:hypothetical protein
MVKPGIDELVDSIADVDTQIPEYPPTWLYRDVVGNNRRLFWLKNCLESLKIMAIVSVTAQRFQLSALFGDNKSILETSFIIERFNLP